MPTRQLDATIVHTGEDCSIVFANHQHCYHLLKDAFKDGAKVTVEVKPRRKPRSLPANAYLHLLLQIIADETGNSLDQVKNTMKAMYAKKPLLNRDGEEIFNPATGEVVYYIQDTRDMDSFEISEFIKNIKQFALEFLNIILPEPDEQLPLKFK